MPKSMLVNVTAEEEHRVAIVENGVLDVFEIETLSKEHLKGNIYKATVEGVNPALEAAFVNYGGERAGFLPLDEVNFKIYPSRNGGSAKGRGARITRHLEKGMEVLAQVIRDSFATKPPTFSTYYSLPGRYLVLMPGADAAGISRKIEDEHDRERLRRTLDSLTVPDGFGVIVRTAGTEVSSRELQADLDALLELWRNIEEAGHQAKAPALIFQERDLVIRTLRDYYTSDIEEVLIDDEPTYRRARRFFEAHMPDKAEVVRLYTGDRPIFTKYNLEDQIERIYKRVVDLKSGGAIAIDQTEALTAIDVNSARSSRSGSSEETAARTNLEAAEEIARQLRLRDIGGLVVIDFIDMESSRNVRQVERAFAEAMSRDKARYDVTRISKLGLMEVSRQRIRSTKASSSFMSCPTCDGDGSIRTPEAAARSAFRKIQTRVARGDVAGVKVYLPPEVGLYLLNEKRDDLFRLESRLHSRVEIVLEERMKPHQFEIEEMRREEPETVPIVTAEVVDQALVSGTLPSAARPVEVAEAPTESAAPPSMPAAGAAGKKRRRRRRRGRGRDASAGPQAPATGPEAPAFSEGPEADQSDAAEVPDQEPAVAGARLPHVADLPIAAAQAQEGRRRRRRRRRGRGRRGGAEGHDVQKVPEPGRAGREAHAPSWSAAAGQSTPAAGTYVGSPTREPKPHEPADLGRAPGHHEKISAGHHEPPVEREPGTDSAEEGKPRRRWWRRRIFKG